MQENAQSPDKVKHILCLFDYGQNCHTGFATVSRNIVKQLKEHFGDRLHLDICAINNFDETTREYDDTVLVMSAKLNQKSKIDWSSGQERQDDFGRTTFLEMLSEKNYDGIFIIIDLGVVASIIPLMQLVIDKKHEKSRGQIKKPKAVIYFPVDGPMHSTVYNPAVNPASIPLLGDTQKKYYKAAIKQFLELEFFDQVVTYTNYGKKEVLSHNPALGDKIKVIYHGSDNTEFFPLPAAEIKKFRKQVFGKNADKFIIGNVNRNQNRKDIPTTILGFQHAKRLWRQNPAGMPEPFLYLHMNPRDFLGWNLFDFLSLSQFDDLKEGRDYMFPVGGDQNYQVDREILNYLYNSLDLSVTTAKGGGWELSLSEAMACKVPVLAPMHTSLAEVCGNGTRGFMLDEFIPVSDPIDNTLRYMCHYEQVGEKIYEIMQLKQSNDFETFGHLIYNAYNWVTNDLPWEVICKEWINIFEKTFFAKSR